MPSERQLIIIHPGLTDLHPNMSDPSTAVTQAKANSTVGTFERKGVFPFLSLPQELRQMVYKLALVSECVQPGIPDSSHKRRYPESYIDYESISAVTLLCTSKQVYYEANIFLYSHNMFTTLYRPSAQQIHDILELLADERGLPKRGWSSDWVARQWTACHDIVAQAVSTIPDPDTSKLAVWLFGDFAPGAVSRWDEWDPWALKPVLGDDPYGFYLVAFLRQIGPSNAAKIQSVELTLDSLPNAANILPLFTEILKQHVKGLQELVIGGSTAFISLFNCL